MTDRPIPGGNDVLVEFDDGIAWVHLNRPEKRNAMSVNLATEMNAVSMPWRLTIAAA